MGASSCVEWATDVLKDTFHACGDDWASLRAISTYDLRCAEPRLPLENEHRGFAVREDHHVHGGKDNSRVRRAGRAVGAGKHDLLRVYAHALALEDVTARMSRACHPPSLQRGQP
jgi:hypothetical protein